MSKSLSLIFATVMIGTTILVGQTTQPTKVVFVCEHGAAKSIIAKAEFERLAKEKGLSVEVVSRGTTPDAEIASGVRKGLLADGTDLGSARPVKISAKDLEGASRVVTFGPDLAEWMPKGVKVLDWSAAPSPSKDYKEARDYIRKQVESLVGDIKK
jgi:protein-tyrosine-phosphatase